MAMRPPAAIHPADHAPATGSTRERILDAAESLFASRGFEGAAMRDIAAGASLNPASLYNHFTSKQALFEAVLERGLRPLFAVLDALELVDWSPESLDAATDTFIAQLARQPRLPALLEQEALSGGRHLTRLTQKWLRPLFDRALATFRGTRAGGKTGALAHWQDEELPILLMTFHHVILGNFALAPMLREVLNEDPLSPDAIERQRRFARKVVRLLVLGRASSEATEAKTAETQGQNRP
jgi:TetR/AcrR family transcriptional regulator